MNAKTYLNRVRTEYKNIRNTRKRLGAEKNTEKQRDLRKILRTEAAYYSGILNEVWDMVEQLEPGLEQEILLRRYVYLESFDRIAADMGYKKASSVYKHHMHALSVVQRLLNAREGDAA